MPDYTLFATVLQRRSYRVQAESSEEAEEILRDAYDQMEFDTIDDELDDVETQE